MNEKGVDTKIIENLKSSRFLTIASLLIILAVIPITVSLALQPQDLRKQAQISIKPPGPSIGILGDSLSDEYRADDNRGGSYAATTFNWVELLQKYRKVNIGPWGAWGEPRRTGYKYNWARSGAKAADLITQGQHTGLAQQVKNGEVSHVIVMIGSNDFAEWNGSYSQIYNSVLNDAQVQQKVNSIIKDVSTAVDTVRLAGNVKLAVANIPDPSANHSLILRFPDASKRQRVTNAIVSVNSGLVSMAKSRGIPIIDSFGFGNLLLSRIKNNNLYVGEVAISVLQSGDEPHHMILSDNIHPGTVASGLVARDLIAAALNAVYGTGIKPFTDQEILINAGIVAYVATPTLPPVKILPTAVPPPPYPF